MYTAFLGFSPNFSQKVKISLTMIVYSILVRNISVFILTYNFIHTYVVQLLLSSVKLVSGPTDEVKSNQIVKYFAFQDAIILFKKLMFTF
jgi:hypothetical protein